ncbi:hypothetical protein B0H10DRAFT_2001510 [Mycena sp. CBHHK59/15]|nr:hypothetical protein B0H10DRAFT_2001510 [Mycena sp. CBHHK59/15]
MFTFTKLPVCVMLALLSVTSIQGAPIDIKGIVESVIAEFSPETTAVGLLQNVTAPTAASSAPAASDSASSVPSASASGVFTVVTSIGGPAITLDANGSTTVWGSATYTIDPPAATSTPSVEDVGTDPSNSTDAAASGSATDSSSASSTDSASASDSASTTDSATSSASSGASSVSGSASTTAKPSASSSSSSKPNAGTTLQPVGISTPLARGLFTVAVGIVFGAWCL